MFTPTDLALASAVAVLAGALQGSVGFGYAIVAVPLLTVVDDRFTPIPVLIVTMLSAAASMWRERHHLDTRGLGWIISGRVPGAILGAWVLSVVTERTLGVVMAVVVLVAVAVLVGGMTIPFNRPNRLVAGLISGFTGASAGIGGPPIALLYRSAPGGAVVRSSMGAIFTIGITINLIVLGVGGVMTWLDWQAAAYLLPATVVGFAVSSYVKHHFDGELLRRSILIVAALAGLVLLAESVAG